jgi:hypothetical protein
MRRLGVFVAFITPLGNNRSCPPRLSHGPTLSVSSEQSGGHFLCAGGKLLGITNPSQYRRRASE